MTTASILCTALLCISTFAADQKGHSSVFACNLKAISAAERPRYNDLMKRLQTAIRHRNELPDGFLFKLDGSTITLREVAEWMTMERLCCPFLTFQLSASGDRTDWLLKLTGADGVKPLLQTEFPAH